MCCGSAGTYNILQPEISAQAARPQGGEHRGDGRRSGRDRQYRLHDADRVRLERADRATVELLDWAYGGPKPAGLPEARAMEAAE